MTLLADELGVDVLDVVTNLFGIEGELIVDEYVMLCPNPDHDDHHPSAAVNVKTGLWACYSCGESGDIIGLGQMVLRKGYLKIRHLLSPDNTDARRESLIRRLRAAQKPAEAPRARQSTEDRPWLPEDAREPHSYRHRCVDLEDYMTGRGFERPTLDAWGVRYVRVAEVRTRRRTAEIRNSVAIPLLDASGVVQAWTYRATPASLSWQPKYLDTLEAPIAKFWHGMHLAGSCDEVVVCEGPLDAMWVWQCGFRGVLSVMGSRTTAEKVNALADFRKVTLLFDRDAAGAIATRKMGELLWNRVPTFVARYPRFAQGTDPQELAPVDIELALANRTPWTAWTLRARLASQPEAR